ncbi:chloride channel protein [Motiliproteus sp. SC1-56]|uniref:chloride channel protein n=1 Tax=Motiliproteus sp. SC1-56 TaxID=2799565 RepID=UPI001A8E8396|nr:chloride channel protein [Motiliproteus sp. SC1-56]
MRMDSFSLTYFRRRLGQVDALPQWVLLGVLSGLTTGLVVLGFRWAITWPLAFTLPGGLPENFEALPPLARLLFPVGGGLLLAIVWSRLATETRKVGIPHVLERLSYHQGHMPWTNLLAQFAGGVISLLSGHSAGREGPAVHLGASISSLLGQWFRLPNNSIRTLVGCGTAAAIAASFNTPMAGVIFAMEVVVLEYSAAGLIPVLVASVCATLLTQVAYSADAAFNLPSLEIQTLTEIPFIVLLGGVMGAMAIVFHRLLISTVQRIKQGIFLRFLLAGLITGIAAIWVPEIMGIGYDTVNLILNGGLSLEMLLILAAAKLLVTAVAIGLGMPMGLIGPALFIGAAAGAAMGQLGAMATTQAVSDPGFYALLGMAAMMGAVLQAPLAALLALLELTLNASVVFPGMVAVLTATILHRHYCRDGSIFQALLLLRNLDWRRPPMDQALDRAAVSEVMHTGFIRHPRLVTQSAAWQLLSHGSDWILVEDEGQTVAAMSSMDLQAFLHQEQETPELDLMAIPAQRRDLALLSLHATLAEALRSLDEANVDAAWVRDHRGKSQGLLLREDIEHFLRQRNYS